MTTSQTSSPRPEPNITLVRRDKLLYLLRDFIELKVAAGTPAKGVESLFAEQLQIHKSLLSQLKTSRPVSDKLARQIEVLCAKEAGWLDKPRDDGGPSAAEEAFIALCRQAWRAQNAKGRRALRQAIKEAGSDSPVKTRG